MQIERERSSATVVLERHRGELSTLHQRIMDDLELDDPDELFAQPVEALDLDLIEAEREIGRLKERLRRVGYIGDEAVQEFERESERHRFLSTQLEDVLTASASLRELLDALAAPCNGGSRKPLCRSHGVLDGFHDPVRWRNRAAHPHR